MTADSIVARHLTKRFRDIVALDDCSFAVAPGEIVGVIGRNGSGKTTLMQCIAGVLQSTEGSVIQHGHVVPVIQLGRALHRRLTVLENLRLIATLLGANMERERDILHFAELEERERNPVYQLSAGTQQRLAFSVALHSDPDVLLLDEAISAGDHAFSLQCIDRVRQMAADGVTILIASHNPNLLRRVCSRIIHLEEGKIVGDGDPSVVIADYEQRGTMRV